VRPEPWGDHSSDLDLPTDRHDHNGAYFQKLATLASAAAIFMIARTRSIGARMRENTENRRKPAIVISQTDYSRLDGLAAAIAARNAEAADELQSELDRAQVVSDAALPANVIRMGSIVEFEPDTGPAKVVRLVFPDEADIAEGRISILTPIGTALIGLKPGQSITWQARDGCQHKLKVVSVRQPEAETAAASAVAAEQ